MWFNRFRLSHTPQVEGVIFFSPEKWNGLSNIGASPLNSGFFYDFFRLKKPCGATSWGESAEKSGGSRLLPETWSHQARPWMDSGAPHPSTMQRAWNLRQKNGLPTGWDCSGPEQLKLLGSFIIPNWWYWWCFLFDIDDVSSNLRTNSHLEIPTKLWKTRPQIVIFDKLPGPYLLVFARLFLKHQ